MSKELQTSDVTGKSADFGFGFNAELICLLMPWWCNWVWLAGEDNSVCAFEFLSVLPEQRDASGLLTSGTERLILFHSSIGSVFSCLILVLSGATQDQFSLHFCGNHVKNECVWGRRWREAQKCAMQTRGDISSGKKPLQSSREKLY